MGVFSRFGRTVRVALADHEAGGPVRVAQHGEGPREVIRRGPAGDWDAAAVSEAELVGARRSDELGPGAAVGGGCEEQAIATTVRREEISGMSPWMMTY